MAEKNIFNKELGKYQSRDEYDAYQKNQAKRLADWRNTYYTQDKIDEYNKYGSDLLNYNLANKTDEWGHEYSRYDNPITRMVYSGDKRLINVGDTSYDVTDYLSDDNTFGNFASDIREFEKGKKGWGDLNDLTRKWYQEQINFAGDNYDTQHGFKNDYLEQKMKEAKELADWRNSYYTQEKIDEYNKYGSALDYQLASHTDKYGNQYNAYGSLIGSTKYSGDNRYITVGDNEYDITGHLSDDFGVWDFRKEINEFEKGVLGWNALSGGTKDWYLANFDPADIVASVDEDGNTITVAEIEGIPVEQPTDPVVTQPADVVTLPDTGIQTDPVVTHEEAKPTTPGEAPAPVTSTVDLNPVVPEVNVGTPEEPVMAPTLNVPEEYNYQTFGYGKKPEGTTTGYQPVDTSHLLSTAPKQPNAGQVLGVGMKWVQDPLTGQYLQVAESDPRPAAFNKGGAVKNYNTGGGADFASDGLHSQLSSSLGHLYDFYEDPANLPAWYGTQYNADTGQYDQVNSQGQTQAEWVAAGGDPNAFQGLNPIAGFNQTQVAGQDALINASGAQGTLAQNLGDAVQTGLSGGYGYQANLQTPTTLGPAQGYQAQNYGASTVQDVQGYTPSQQADANYVNQYLNPAVQQAQQAAIANVNAGFGQGGTLGGARNARAATQAAVQASLPTLSQGASQEFAAQQAINAANQGAQNAAAQFGASAANQAGFQNQAAQNVAAQFNAQANTAANQYGANVGNQFAQANAGILNAADAANAAAANQASQYNLGNIANWAGMIPTASQQFLNQGNTLQQVGQQQYDLGQQQINQDVQAWNYLQNLPAQQLYNQLHLGQLAQAGQAGNIGTDIGGSNSSPFDFGNLLNLGIQGGGGGGLGGALGGLGSLFGFNNGGMIPGKAGLMRRRG